MPSIVSSNKSESFFVDMWYRRRWWATLFLPLSTLYGLLSGWRKKHLLRQQRPCPAPTIVVGNISVGGTGKTPLVIALVEALKKAGRNPGIVSRGYGSRAPHYPFEVTTDSNSVESGDEPLLLAQRCQCPVVIDPDRNAAVDCLLQQYQVDVVVSDDGLQHYRMPRSLEIVVVDGERGFGNGWLLPAGPLRESSRRLNSVNRVVVNRTDTETNITLPALQSLPKSKVVEMHVRPVALINIGDGREVAINAVNGRYALEQDAIDDGFISDKKVQAISGIGNPQRFFALLDQLSIRYQPRVFPDHHDYRMEDLDLDKGMVITTEKDAVKLRNLFQSQAPELDTIWYLKIDAILDDDILTQLTATLT